MNQKALNQVVNFVKQSHDGQKRSGGEDYWRHPQNVVLILKSHGITSPAVLLSAWCHDLVEDCDDCSVDSIRKFISSVFNDKMLGINVGRLVSELTNDTEGNFEVRQRSLVNKCKTMSPQAKQVKLADRLDNLLSLDDSGWPNWKRVRYEKAAHEIVLAMHPVPIFTQRLSEIVWNSGQSVIDRYMEY